MEGVHEYVERSFLYSILRNGYVFEQNTISYMGFFNAILSSFFCSSALCL